METAARTHWRAAAWLLERTQPEEFARKPVNLTSAKKVDAAFRYIQEAALAAIPAEFHAALYQQTQQAMETALAECFPTMGAWGQPKQKQLPFKTPLADVQLDKIWQAQTFVVPDRTAPVDERFDDRPELYVDVEVATDLGPIEVSLPPEDYRHMQQVIAAAQARAGMLSPKTSETTEFNVATELPPATKTPPPTEELAATRSGALPDQVAPSPADVLSPKKSAATKSSSATTMFGPAAALAMAEHLVDTTCPQAWFENDDFDHPDAADPQVRFLLLDERLRRHKRRERQQERAAEKKTKAAKKRAEASRRRAA